MSNIKELIRQNIDAYYAEYKDKFHQNGDPYHLGIIDGLDIAERILDTLPDEPVTDCHDLEEAAEKHAIEYAEKEKPKDADGEIWRVGDVMIENRMSFEDGFKAGAEWQKAKMLKDNPVIMSVEDFQALIDSHAKRVEADYKEKMMEGAVDGFIFQSADYYPKQLIAGYNGELGMGDKVKIIIIKEKE